MKSIKTKLVVYFSILILVSSIFVGFIGIQGASNALTEQAEGSLELVAHEGSRLMEARIEGQKDALGAIAIRRDIVSMEWEKQQSLIKEVLSETSFLDLGVSDLNGNIKFNDGTTLNIADIQYFKDALNGKTGVSDVIISRISNKPELMYSAPIKSDGKVVGILVGRIDAYRLSEMVESIGFGKTGYSYMIDKKGTTVAHREREQVAQQFNFIESAKTDESLKSLALSITDVLKNKKGTCEYTYRESDYYIGYAPVPDTEWYLIIATDKLEVLSAIPNMKKEVLSIASIILLVSIAATYIIGNSIAKPIIKVKGDAEILADLDITHDIDSKLLNQKDEIGDLANSIQNVITNLRTMVNEISNSSDQVAGSSEELTATSNQSASAVEQVAMAIGEVARGAADQAHNTEVGSSKASELGKIIASDQDYMRDVNSSSLKVSEAVEAGLVEIEKLSSITDETSLSIKEIREIILRTNESSDKIGQASNIIGSIAEQTNLLALNAAIEAARAGDAGRGFAVVADEIRKLAEQSSTSTRDIDQVVNELQENAGEAVQTVEKVSSIAIEQSNSVVNSKEKFMLIAESMANSVDAIDKLNDSGKKMEKMKDEILHTLQNLAAIAEENSASTQEVSASMEEQAASMEEISSASEGLSKLAEDLQGIILKFKI